MEGQTLFKGISLALKGESPRMCNIESSHHPESNSYLVVFLNQLSENPSKETALS
jgi:hypothetical protein